MLACSLFDWLGCCPTVREGLLSGQKCHSNPGHPCGTSKISCPFQAHWPHLVVEQAALSDDVHGDLLGVNLQHLSNSLDEGVLLALNLGATVVKLDLQAAGNRQGQQNRQSADDHGQFTQGWKAACMHSAMGAQDLQK